MTNESFSLPSELPATPHGIANCDPLLVQQTTRGAIQREGLLGVLIRPRPIAIYVKDLANIALDG